MTTVLSGLLRFFLAFLRSRALLAAENTALRHQLGILRRQSRRLKLGRADRII